MEININKYEDAIRESATEVEAKYKICTSCIRLEVRYDSRGEKYGVDVVPMLTILKVVKGKDDEIIIYWQCPECHNIKVIESYKDWNVVISYLEALEANNRLTRYNKRILRRIQNGQLEQLPGYTTNL